MVHDNVQNDSAQHGDVNLRVHHDTQVNHNAGDISDMLTNLCKLNRENSMNGQILNATEMISEEKEKLAIVEKPPRLRKRSHVSLEDVTELSSKRWGHRKLFTSVPYMAL